MSDERRITRSAETGEFVSDDEAAEHPDTTVVESREPFDHERELARLHEEIATLTEECRNRAAWRDKHAAEVEHLRERMGYLLQFARGNEVVLKIIHDALDWRYDEAADEAAERAQRHADEQGPVEFG